ncbi:MAG: histidine--tRNA ligase [Clostridiales bacterium]|jgi:histidyl-tRNA synthetase|nr:histidine--tRNA ligase [Clostridiales bacterium]
MTQPDVLRKQHLRTPKGTRDLYGGELYAWRRAEQAIEALCEDFGYGELRTPVFEYTELFYKSTGETTDVVQKEMYTFETKGEKSLTLKPEGTPGTVRAFVEHGLSGAAQPTRLYYLTPLFRYEQPQAGRMRQFHSFGAELFGSKGPAGDAEIISLAQELFRRLGLDNVTLNINSLGGPQCRRKYNQALKGFLSGNINGLCETCRERFERNPLRVLDCKNPDCQKIIADAPSTIDTLDEECRAHFMELRRLLTEMDIAFEINPRIVRGLDYYIRTVFEFVSPDIGAQSTVCGGGRYDPLLVNMGGPDIGATGFGLGMERLMLALGNRGLLPDYQPRADIYIGSAGAEGFLTAQKLTITLRRAGLRAEADITERSVKAQMKYADKTGALFSTIIGSSEIETGTIKIKEMATGESQDVEIAALVSYMKGVRQCQNQ